MKTHTVYHTPPSRLEVVAKRLAIIFVAGMALFAAALCTAQPRKHRQQYLQKRIELTAGDSTWQADSTPYLNPNGKTIIGRKRNRHTFRVLSEHNGHGFFVLNENGTVTGQTDSSVIDNGKRRKRRKTTDPKREGIEQPAPAMIPFDRPTGTPLEPEMAELVTSNDGYNEIDVVVTYKAWQRSGLAPEPYQAAFMLDFAKAAEVHRAGGNKMRVRNFKINTSPDAYTGAGANARMSKLRLDYPNHTAHNMMLVDDEPGNGGVAWFATACNTVYSSYRYSYVSVKLGTMYSKLCITHELGHAFGLNHAFYCGWELRPGVYGAIDSTYTCEAYNGVKCFSAMKKSYRLDPMGYHQLHASDYWNIAFTPVSAKKLTTYYTNALVSGCITGGQAEPPAQPQEGVPGAVTLLVKSGKSWFSFPIATDAVDWQYEVSYCSYQGTTPPDSMSKPKACSIRNGFAFTKPTADQLKVGRIELLANPQPATKGLWYKVQVRYRKGSTGVIQVKNSGWSVW